MILNIIKFSIKIIIRIFILIWSIFYSIVKLPMAVYIKYEEINEEFARIII